MNRETILALFDEISDKYVMEAAEGRGQSARKIRIFLIAAAAALLLVGCGIVYILSMGTLKLEDREWTDPYVYTDGPVTQRIISTGGPQGTGNYSAAKEWHDFETAYDKSHDWDESFLCPPEYEAYYIYSQEMVDKLEEILSKYNLNPIGAEVVGENEKGLLDYLGIDQILLPGVPAQPKDLSVRYHEGGQLSTYCYLQMEEGDGRWPYETYTHCLFTPKGLFDNGLFILDHPEQWTEWDYTTASGETFLVLYNPNYWEAYALCDRGDRMVAVYIQTAKQLYTNNRVSEEKMNERQVEQLLDVFDFSLTPTPSDPALLSGLPAGLDTSNRVQTQDGFTVALKEAVSDGHLAWITLGITIPENIAAAQVSDTGETFWNLEFGGMELQSAGQAPLTGYSERDDGDGLDNTLELVITWTGENLNAGSQQSLTLEKMRQRLRNPAKDDLEIIWENDSVWKFDFTFDEGCDYQALEFLSEPTEIPAVLRENGQWGTMTIREFTLRRNSVTLLVQEPVGYGALNDWDNGKDPAVVLKDGSAIPFRAYRGSALDETNTLCQENLRPDRPIPMEEVDHILLADGTKLYPQA